VIKTQRTSIGGGTALALLATALVAFFFTAAIDAVFVMYLFGWAHRTGMAVPAIGYVDSLAPAVFLLALKGTNTRKS